MNTKEFNFSASSIKSYLHCGLKFKFEKVDKLPTPPETSHFRWLGKLVHTSIYQSIATFNTDADEIKRWDVTEPKPDVQRALAFYFKGFKGEPTEDDPDIYMKSLYPYEIGTKPVGRFFPRKDLSILNHPSNEQAKLEDGWKTVGQGMVETGISVVSKIPEIVFLEKAVSFYIDERHIRGFIDVLGKDADGKYVIYDFKTSWRKPTQKTMEADLQFILYSYAIKELYGLDYYPTAYFVHLKSGECVPLHLTDELLEKAFKKIKGVFSNLEDDMYFDDMGGVLCNYCDFYNLCYNS